MAVAGLTQNLGQVRRLLHFLRGITRDTLKNAMTLNRKQKIILFSQRWSLYFKNKVSFVYFTLFEVLGIVKTFFGKNPKKVFFKRRNLIFQQDNLVVSFSFLKELSGFQRIIYSFVRKNFRDSYRSFYDIGIRELFEVLYY